VALTAGGVSALSENRLIYYKIAKTTACRAPLDRRFFFENNPKEKTP
jgi:hypothetical protein